MSSTAPTNSGYWQHSMGSGLRPSWKFACPKLQSQPLPIIGRSRVGKQMLCRGNKGLHLLMFCGGAWGFVGGVISFKGEPVGADEVCSAMFVEDENETIDVVCGQILIQFELSDANAPERRRSPPRVGVLHTTAHACSDAAAFRWIFDAEQRRALGRRLGEHTATRAEHIGATLGGMLGGFLQLDAHARELSPTLDFLPVYHAVAPLRELKLHGRPRFSADRTSRGFRSSSLKDDQEEACMATLIAVLSTVHRSSDQWRVDITVQLLFAHTHAARVLQTTRPTQRSRVGQLRRWLPFVKVLAVATDDFRHEADEQLLGQCGQRAGWGVKRAPRVTERVLQWVDEGMRADAVFAAQEERPEWETGDLTAAEWVERCFIHIKRESASALCAAPSALLQEQDHAWACIINPFVGEFGEMRCDIMAAVHDGIEVTGPSSEQHRAEHVGKVHGLLDGVLQNVGTYMRNCKGVVDLSRKLQTHLHRMRKVGQENQRLLAELRVAAGAYTEDVVAAERTALAATRALEDLMRCRLDDCESPALHLAIKD